MWRIKCSDWPHFAQGEGLDYKWRNFDRIVMDEYADILKEDFLDDRTLFDNDYTLLIELRKNLNLVSCKT